MVRPNRESSNSPGPLDVENFIKTLEEWNPCLNAAVPTPPRFWRLRHDRFEGCRGWSATVSGVPERNQSGTLSAKSEQRTPPPFSLRLTFEERARLDREAGDMPLGTYIRSRLFNEPATDRPSRKPKRPIKDHQALANVLGELGKSRIANNLNQLAKDANSGSLPLNPETENSLREACAGVQWLRLTLMQALGLRP